jgi:hypothetical protein
VSSHDREIKVTDKRMFTPDGELREEYRGLLEKAIAAPSSAAAETPPEPTRPAQPAPPPAPPRSAGAGRRPAQREPEPPPQPEAPFDFPEEDSPGFGPSFYDLVAMMAEPIPIYLGDVDLPNGQSAENLEMARLHIDLLDVLRQKTAGNLSAQEAAFLEDLLYRMRVRYVQKTR